jgi:hypothetical protein
MGNHESTGRGRSTTGAGTLNGTGPGTGAGSEAPLVGAVRDAHQVTDTAALQAEADAALAAAPIDTGPAPVPAGPSTDDMAAGYAMLAGATLGTLTEMACPAWQITDDEKNKFADALGKACALWFPGEIPEKWVALIVVAGVGAQIVAQRRDPRTGGLKPRFYARTIEQPKAPAPAGPAPDPHRPLN